MVAVPGVLDSMSDRIGFARVGLTGFAAFDLETGASLAEATLDGAVIDLDWDELHSKLLVVSLTAEGEEANVSSFELESGSWTPIATSKPLPAGTHVVVNHGTVIALSEDVGVSWCVLDDALAPVSTSKLLGRPSGIASVSPTELWTLDPNGGDATGYEDLLRSVRLSPLSELERIAFPAPERPASRWTALDAGRTLMLVRKREAETSFELGKVTLGSTLHAPVFTRRDVPAATGALAALSFDPARKSLVALLSSGRLLLLPLDPEAEVRSIELESSVETNPWPSRQLVLHASSDTLLVATDHGVRAFRGTLPLGEFVGNRYAAPLVVR